MKMGYEDFKYLGRQGSGPTRDLDAFNTPEGVVRVEFESLELCALCPVTGQPDIYECIIEYLPLKKCLESKSLKLYLWSFRDVQEFAETLAAQIADDVYEAIEPVFVHVTLIQNVRGGLRLTVEAERSGDVLRRVS